MPLKKGKKNIGKNIKELKEKGKIKRPMKQIIAIAISASKPKKKTKKPKKKY